MLREWPRELGRGEDRGKIRFSCGCSGLLNMFREITMLFWYIYSQELLDDRTGLREEGDAQAEAASFLKFLGTVVVVVTFCN